MSWNPVFLFGKEYIYKIFTYILTIRYSDTILYIKFIYINILYIKKEMIACIFRFLLY